MTHVKIDDIYYNISPRSQDNVEMREEEKESRFRDYDYPRGQNATGLNKSHSSTQIGVGSGGTAKSSPADIEYESLDDIEFQQVISILNKYVIPVIIIVGIVGNALSFFVYVSTPRLYRQSSSLYLAFLALVDDISLVAVLVVWFGWVGVYIFHKNGWCQTITYGTYVCSFLSAWTVVTFTVERWIVVFHPLRRHELCTRRRAIITMTSLTLTSLAFYSFALYETTVIEYNGMPVCTTNNSMAVKVVRSIDTVITVIVPLVAIILMNAAIGIKICHYTGRATLTKHAGGGGGVGGVGGGVVNQHTCAPAEDSADKAFSNCSSTAGVQRNKYVMDVLRRIDTKTPNGLRVGRATSPPGLTSPRASPAPMTTTTIGAQHNKYIMDVLRKIDTKTPTGVRAGGSPPPPGATVTPPRVAPPSTTTMTVGALQGATSIVASWRVLTRRQHTQARVTSALLVVSTVFVVLNLPSYAFRVHAFVISICNETYDALSLHAYIWQEFIQFLYYANISSRFFLYSACSRNFRYAVKRLVKRVACWGRARDASAT